MEELRYYRTLGLPAGADIRQIKSAYRVLAKKYHPDMSKDPSTGEEFRRVVTAYKTLVAREEKRSFINSKVHQTYRSTTNRTKKHNQTNEAKDSLYSIGQLLLHGKTPSMRAFAAKRLGFTKQKGAYAYLRKALNDPSETVVLAVIESIGRLQMSISAKELESVFDGGSQSVKLAVLNAIKMCNRRTAFVGILIKGMQSLDRRIRSKSISLFAHTGKGYN